ncbi:hypothetical protein ACQP0C_00805 [Nocardia sp. CA-129566]|uniref:hypothetical protein n=1 Tax=Nocardia sp. CA-129566 TaxID=3239976 RepID=UPI003D96ADED
MGTGQWESWRLMRVFERGQVAVGAADVGELGADRRQFGPICVMPGVVLAWASVTRRR